MADIQRIIEQDKAHYMNTYGDRIPLCFTHGQGSTLFDQDGRSYLDFLGGIAVNALGYGDEEFASVIGRQAAQIAHCSNYFYIEQQAELARMLCEATCADRVFFGSTGSEANEGAIKLARKYFRKQGVDRYEIISTLNSFHGRTLGALAATGQDKYRAPFSPMPAGFINVPYGDAKAVEQAMTERTCAVLVECIQGEGGVIPGGREYLSALRALCDEKGVLLIMDEVQTGMGRTGSLFAHQHYGVEPDIFTSAKALGNGLPIGALLCKELCAAFEPGDHGTTFGGNPLSCSAGIYALSRINRPEFLASVARKGEALMDALRRLANNCPAILDVRGAGLMIGIELDKNHPVKKVSALLRDRGVIVGTAGGNTLRLLPPLVMHESELLSIVPLLQEILA